MPSFRRVDHRAAWLRAGDADRERAAAELTRHCGEGRLTPEELSQRLELALGAVTVAELETLLSDLPADLAPAHSRWPRRRAITAASAVGALTLALPAAGAVVLAAESPEAAVLLAAGIAVMAVALAAVLVPLAAAAAPFVLLAVTATWIMRRLGEGRARIDPPFASRPAAGSPPR